MKGLIYIGIIVGVIATITVVVWLVVVAIRYSTKERTRNNWEEARSNAKWEEFVDWRDGQTYVGIRRIARVGRKSENLREEIMPGFPKAFVDPIEVETALWEARRRLELLNK